MDSHQSGSANCLPPNAQVGEYRLLDVIGEGGFGIVYRAQDLSLDRVVAIKEYLPATMASRGAASSVHVRSQHRGAFDAGLRSFINEARLLAKFSHPALVQVYRFLESNGTAYMVMCCYEGQTLRSYLEGQPKGLDERWLKATMCPLLDVLEMLHAADCYHRDIAPDNVFLQRSGMPVLLDFGAARRIIGDMTQALTMVLKPGFAPIEQYAEDGTMPQGAWTDIYQLGALLYQVITGKTPTTAVARMINDPIKPLTSAQYPAYSDAFLGGVHRALAVKPQDRPQSIAELKTLLGIGDFSSGSFSRFTTGLSSLEVSPAGTATPALQVPHDHLFPITMPAAPPAAPMVTTAAKGHDELLSLFDGASAPSEKRAPEKEADRITPAMPVRAPVEKRSEPVRSAKHHAASQQTTGDKPDSFRQGYKFWAAAAGAVVLLGGLLHLFTSAGSSSSASAEDSRWAAVLASPSASSLRDYLATYPQGKYRAEAEQQLQAVHADVRSSSEGEQMAANPPAEELGNASSAAQNTAGPTEAGSQALQREPQTVPEQMVAEPTTSVELTTSVLTAEVAEEAPPLIQGKVVLRITPWGRIQVNRRSFGVTPPRMELSLPVGQHRILVTNPAAPPMVWDIKLTEDEPVVLTHHFAETPAPLPGAN